MELPVNVSKGQSISALNTNIAFNAIKSLSMQVQALGQYQRSIPLSSISGCGCGCGCGGGDIFEQIKENKETITNILRPFLAQPFEIYADVKHIKCTGENKEEFFRVSVKMKNGYILWDKYRLVSTIAGRNLTTDTNYVSENSQSFIREVKVGQALMRFASEEDITIVRERDVPIDPCNQYSDQVYISAILQKDDQTPSAYIYFTETDIQSFTAQRTVVAEAGQNHGELCIGQVDTQIPLAGFHLSIQAPTCKTPVSFHTEITQMWRGNMYAKAVRNANMENQYCEKLCAFESFNILTPTKLRNDNLANMNYIEGFVVLDQNWAGAVDFTVKNDGSCTYNIID